jgi:hypothetical protein
MGQTKVHVFLLTSSYGVSCHIFPLTVKHEVVVHFLIDFWPCSFPKQPNMEDYSFPKQPDMEDCYCQTEVGMDFKVNIQFFISSSNVSLWFIFFKIPLPVIKTE